LQKAEPTGEIFRPFGEFERQVLDIVEVRVREAQVQDAKFGFAYEAAVSREDSLSDEDVLHIYEATGTGGPLPCPLTDIWVRVTRQQGLGMPRMRCGTPHFFMQLLVGILVLSNFSLSS
jgi:hypothetical protein